MTMYKALHKYYEDCFSEGVFDPDKVIGNGLIDKHYNVEYRLKVLESIYKLVLEAKFNNDMSIYYLTHSSKTFDDCVLEHNRLSGEDLNIKTGRSRMIYCSRKINEVFEEVECGTDNMCIIDWLFNKTYHMNIDDNEVKSNIRDIFVGQLNRFNDMYGEQPTLGKKDILISMPPCKKVEELSDERFDEFMDIIRPYSREYMRHIQEEVNSMLDEVGYIKYLLSPKSELTDIDKERKNIVLRWLGKPEIIINTVDDVDNIESDEEVIESDVDGNNNYNDDGYVDGVYL